MTARTCNNCGQEFDTGECGANHGCSEQVTSEKETPVYTTTYAFGVVPDTPKTVEEVVEEFGQKFSDEENFIQRYDYEIKDWLRTTLTAQNQAAEERLREERKRVSRFLVERGERADDYDEYVRAVEQAELDQDVSK